MPIKMLRKNGDGNIEVFYVDSFEEKQLYDTRSKKYRQLNQNLSETYNKQSLRERQKLARELRVVITKLKEME
ncbi:hypothetical protein [Sporosarcina psychrophila]|uniref:hypothetical protein n=1 Tax=Sporosarcina psychrophila TaxID=1476 RepID=UPI00078C38A8|nr:hypothetical protein [Sporosarcina psychrophila]AMQ06724.1 hypothetical protein AZE41_12715 [Sporosarcina psychrophila]